MKRLPPTPNSIPRCISNATSPCTSAMGTPCSTPIFTPTTTCQMAAGVPPLSGLTLPPAMSTPDSGNNASGNNNTQSTYFKRYLSSWVSSTTTGGGDAAGGSLPPTPILNIGIASRTNSVFDGEDCNTTPSIASPSMNVSYLSGVSASGAAGVDPTMRRRSSMSVGMMQQTTTSTYECRRSMKNYFGRSSAASTPITTPRGDDPAGTIASDIMMQWAKTPPRRCGTPTRARSMTTSACSTPRANAMANFTSPPPPQELLMNDFDHLPYYSSSASAAAPMDMGMAHSPTFDRLVQRKRENMCSAEASELQEIQGLLATSKSSKRASRPATPSSATTTPSTKLPQSQLHDDPYCMYDATSYSTTTANVEESSIRLTSSKRSPHSVLSKMEKFARSEYMRKNAARFEQYKAVAGDVSEYTSRHVGAPVSAATTTDAFLVSGSAQSTPTKLRTTTTDDIAVQTPPSRRQSELEEDENISADTPKTNKKRQQQHMATDEAVVEDNTQVVTAIDYTSEKLAVFEESAATANAATTKVATRTSSLSAAAISTSLSPRSRRSLSQTQPLVDGRVLEGGAPPPYNTTNNNNSGRRSSSSSQLLRQLQASSSSSPRTQSPPVHTTTTRKTVQPKYANLAT